jgi:hypothetical protein
MPTYKNVHHSNIVFPLSTTSIILKPLYNIKTTFLLDHISGLVRIDDLPSHNMLVDMQVFDGKKDEVKEFNFDYREVGYIKITTCNYIELFINSINNLPSYKITGTYSFDIDSYKKIDKIYLKFVEDSYVELMFMKKKEKLYEIYL